MKVDFNISIDDGRKEMLRVADLLDKYELKGIFYIAPFEQRNTLSINDIQNIAQRHEIGGHTLRHIKLTTISIEEAKKEIEQGKEQLESIIGRKITRFASPRGWHNDEIIEIIKKAGYTRHRTTKMGITNREGYDDYHLPCSAHFYPRQEYENSILNSILEKLDQAFTGGGYFDVLIHTDELDRYKQWENFEIFLRVAKTLERINK